MIIKTLLIIIASLNAVYFVILLLDIFKHKEETKMEKGNSIYISLFSCVVMFLGTFGLSDTVLNMFGFRSTRIVDDKRLPGTIITCSIMPVGAMAITYISTCCVDPITLITCIVSQTLGSFLGVKYITKLKVDIIRIIIGIALTLSAIFIITKRFFLQIDAGAAIGITADKLIFVLFFVFIFGALNMIGLGSTIPIMSILLISGMKPTSIFPIVMAGNSISCTIGGIKYIKQGEYQRKIALLSSIFGILGVLAAVKIIKNINLDILQILMIILLIYTVISLIYEEIKEIKNKSLQN